MKESFKESTVILFMLIASGLLLFSQFAVNDIRSPLDETPPTKINILGGDVALELKSSRIIQYHMVNAAIAALTLAADDEDNDEDGAGNGKDNTQGPDRLWDSVLLG
jgi:hypothetical protein